MPSSPDFLLLLHRVKKTPSCTWTCIYINAEKRLIKFKLNFRQQKRQLLPQGNVMIPKVGCRPHLGSTGRDKNVHIYLVYFVVVVLFNDNIQSVGTTGF